MKHTFSFWCLFINTLIINNTCTFNASPSLTHNTFHHPTRVTSPSTPSLPSSQTGIPDSNLKKIEAYHKAQQFTEALEFINTLIAQYPHNAHYILQKANTLNMLNKTEEALIEYRRLLHFYPQNAPLNYNVAYTLKKLGRFQEAMPYYQTVLTLEPHHAEAHFSLGLAYLANGDFAQGWPLYEWRFKRTAQKNPRRTYPKPEWDGSDLTGKRIFLYAEQGLGDTFQFIRYAQEVKKHNGYVIVAVQDPLIDIVRLCPYIDHVISLKSPIPFFDTYAPLMSLPHILKTTLDTIPNQLPYLYADPDLVAYWHQTLNDTPDTLSGAPSYTKAYTKTNNTINHKVAIKVGLCWQGKLVKTSPFFQSVAAAKSLSCSHFKPLGVVPHVRFYNLQQQEGVSQAKLMPDTFNLVSFDKQFDNAHGRFMDTAAVIKNLDLVITVDTSIAHLSAGLGTPTWVLLPNPADWRWLLDTQDSPWYPNMRLFRQSTPGDWNSVIKTVTQELSTYVSHTY